MTTMERGSRGLDVMRRVGAVLWVSIALAAARLFVAGDHLRGSPVLALAVLALVLAGPLLLVGTIVRAVLAAIAPALASDRAALALSAAAFGTLSAIGMWPRLALGLVCGLVAVATSGSPASSSRGTGSSDDAGSRRGPAWPPGRWGVVTAVGLVVLLGLPRWIVRGTENRHAIDLRPLVATRESSPSVLVLGLDGADGAVLDELIARGELPALARFIAEGTRRPMRTLVPTSSPFIWNALYSGFSPAAHRLRPVAFAPTADVLVRARPRRTLPDVPSELLRLHGTRQVRHPFAFWDLLAAAGYDVGVIGAWEDEPVPAGARVFSSVSHHVVATSPPTRVLDLAPSRHLSIDPALAERAGNAGVAAAVTDIPHEEWMSLLADDGAADAVVDAPYADGATPTDQRLARLRAVYASDRLRVGLLKETLPVMTEPYCVFAYIRGIDVAQHCFLHQRLGEIDPRERAFGDVIASYYRRVDAWLGEILSEVGDDTLVLIVSDHGIDPTERRAHPYKTGFHDFAPNGVFVANVPSPGDAVDEPVHVLDVAPTILSRVGLPVHAGMEGRVIPFVTERTYAVDDWWSLMPTEYERGNPELSTPEMERFLKSIGYL